SSNSERVLTSATKALGTSVQEMLDRYYNDDFPGGDTVRLGADQDGVSLPMENSRFEETDLGREFTQSDYDAIYSEIADGDVVVPETYSDLETFFSDNDLDSLEIEQDTVEPPEDE
ncbi:MAG: hypothetical protein ACOCSM_03075, partial [Bacillota bacterium]